MIKSILIFNKDILSLSIFLILSLSITLFPPYSWGDERLSTEKERNKIYCGKRAYEIFPIKQYDFVFNDIKKEFFIGWSWDRAEQKSVKAKTFLSRHLIISELIINYLIAFFVSLFIFILKDKMFYKFKNEPIQ